jgi:hypothetical protein
MSATSAVTLSNENGPSRFWPCQESCPADCGRERPANAPRRPGRPNAGRRFCAGRP